MTHISLDEKYLNNSYFIGFASSTYKSSYSNNGRSLLSDKFAIRLKEMIQHPLYSLINPSAKELEAVFKEMVFFLLDLNMLVKANVDCNDTRSLRFSLNEIRQLLESYDYIKIGGKYKKESEQNSFNDFKMEDDADYINLNKRKLLLAVVAIPFGIYAFKLYKKLYLNTVEPVNVEILDMLKASSKVHDKNFIFDLILEYFNQPENVYARTWDEWIWGIEDRFSGVGYTMPTSYDFLAFGLLIFLLENQAYVFIPDNYILENNSFDFLISRAIELLPMVINKPTSWLDQIKLKGDVELIDRAAIVKKYLGSLTRAKEKIYNENLAKSPLSLLKIEQFKADITKQWRAHQNLTIIFSYFEGVSINPQDELMRIGLNINAENIKPLFLEDTLIQKYDFDYGKIISRNKERLLGRVFQQNNIKVHKELNIADGLLNSIKILNDYGFSPNIIFSTHHSFFKNESVLNNSGNFLPARNVTFDKLPFKYLGIFKETIPIVRIYADFFEDKIIVAELNKGLRLKQREKANWIDKRLQIIVKEIDDASSQEIYQQNINNFRDMSSADALLKIKGGVIIDIDEICNFEILNSKALHVFEI